MASDPLPPQQRGTLERYRWFVLFVVLAPMLCCGGCLGFALFSAWMPRSGEALPTETAPEVRPTNISTERAPRP